MPISTPSLSPQTTPQPIGPRAVTAKHALYQLFEGEWTNLAHVREGTGGFMDGTFLVAHPREWIDHEATTPKTPTAKFKARRTLAHYENIAATILEAKKAVLFRETPTRRVGVNQGDDPTELDRWWADITGSGDPIDGMMPLWWDIAATFGHCALLFTPPSTEGVLTAADQDGPMVRAYTPLDILNWLVDDRGQIVAVKLAEAVPVSDYLETASSQARFRVREVTADGWTLFAETGDVIASGEHGLGRLPVAWLYGQRRAIVSEVGQSILGRSQQYIDLYNLVSELRELLRNQTFSFINLPLGSGADSMSVTDAQAMIGETISSGNVLFSALPAQILAGDSSCVEAYQTEISQRKRDIFRITGVQWESDSRDAESGDSLRLKREDMNTRIAGYADECQQAEMDLVNLWYRWRYGPDAAEAKQDSDQVTVQYPDRFDTTSFEDLALQLDVAKQTAMPPAFIKAMKKSMVSKFDGLSDLDPDTLAEIMGEIDAQEDIDPIEQQRAMLQVRAEGFGDNDESDDEDDEDNEPTNEGRRD